jgi:hypothetical protein
MADEERKKGGGRPPAPKQKLGSNWLRDRKRAGRSWQERKMRSHRYCPPTKTRG